MYSIASCVCCVGFCFRNAKQTNSIDICVGSFFLGVWGLINFIWFTCHSYPGISEGFYYLVSFLHLQYLLNAIAWALIAKSFYLLTAPFDYSVRFYGYPASDSNWFLVKNVFIVFINLLHTPLDEGYLNTIYCILPVLLQAIHCKKIYWEVGNLILICCVWGLSMLAKGLGFNFIWSCIYYLISNFGIYFVEYPFIIFFALYAGKQIKEVVSSIENYVEGIKTSGKTKNQVKALAMKELFYYLLLGFSLIFFHYFGEVIEWYHGYMPALISFVINLVYSYPAVILLKYPTTEGDYGLRHDAKDIANFVGVLFSNYLVRCLV